MTLDLSKQSLNDCQRHQRWNTETYAVFKYSRTEYCIPRMNNLSCTLVKGHTAFHYLLCFWDFEVDSCHWNSWNVWKIEILYFPMCYRNVFQPAGRVHHIEESCVFVSLLCTASHPSHRGAGPLLRRLLHFITSKQLLLFEHCLSRAAHRSLEMQHINNS